MLVACSGLLAAASGDMGKLQAQLQAEKPAVTWDWKSAVEGDFEGGGGTDLAVLGVLGKRAVLAIGHPSGSGGISTQYLEFSVGQAQDAICSLPAKLKVYPLSCSDDGGGSLPGYRASPSAKLLSIDDGNCDPINLYWSHILKRVVWFRTDGG